MKTEEEEEELGVITCSRSPFSWPVSTEINLPLKFSALLSVNYQGRETKEIVRDIEGWIKRNGYTSGEGLFGKNGEKETF